MSLLDKRATCLLAFLLFWVGPLYAQPAKSIVILLSGDSVPYLEVDAGIRSAINEASQGSSIRTVFLKEVNQTNLLDLKEDEVVVAVGTRATEYALTKTSSKQIFSTFVTRNSLLSALQKDGAGGEEYIKRLQRAIVLDQPAERVISLVKLISPQAMRLGTVVNGSAPNRLGEFEQVIKDAQFQLEVAELFDDSNPIKDLKRIFSISDVFVVIPDRSRFNSKVAKWILFLSYRHRVPVIGYSQKYTDAGALISLYSSPTQVGQDAGEQLVGRYIKESARTRNNIIRYPRYFNLAVNETVADSLGVKVGDKRSLKKSLIEMEGNRGNGGSYE